MWPPNYDSVGDERGRNSVGRENPLPPLTAVEPGSSSRDEPVASQPQPSGTSGKENQAMTH